MMAKRHARGVALVAVLWIVSLLALMAAGTGSSGRVSARLAFNSVENAKARHLADGGLERAIYYLLRQDTSQLPQVEGALNLSFRLENHLVAVQVRDEDGKIDVNVADQTLLKGLLRSVGMEDGEAESMAARIADFRDDDSEARPSGAEDPAYQAAGLSHGAQDRPLRHLEELRRVLGMTDRLYQRLSPHVTIYADSDGLDPLRASERVLWALPGMTPEVAEVVRSIDGQDADLLFDLPDEVTDPFEDYILPSRNLVYQIRALGRTGDGGLFLREAVVALDPAENGRPFSILLLRRGALTDTDPLLRIADSLDRQAR